MYSNVFIYIYIYIYIYVIGVYMYVYICLYVHICISKYLCIYIYIQMLPPKIYNFKLFVDVKEVVLLSKKISTYSGQKAQHFLKEAICFQNAAFLSMLEKRHLDS